MRILGIDSSTPRSSIALLDDGILLSQVSYNNTNKAVNPLLRLTDELLSNLDMTLKDVDAFAVTTGPGSFTGLRVGVGLVKGFLLFEDKPVVGVGTLEAWAAAMGSLSSQLCIALDARKNQVYAGVYRNENGIPQTVIEPSAWNPESLCDRIQEPTVFIGTGLDPFGGLFKRQLGTHYLEPQNDRDWTPAAGAALLFRSRQPTKSQFGRDLLKINYIRKSEAEINFKPVTMERR